jgi:hypothetical protein
MEKKSLSEKWQSVQEMCVQVQETMDNIASMFERITKLVLKSHLVLFIEFHYAFLNAIHLQ